jgi:lysophospholipase L1-like esterase
MKHTLALLLTAVAVAGCSGGVPSAPPTPSAPLPATYTAARLGSRVIFIGDSITAGWDVADYVGKGTYNVGVSGQTSAEMYARFKTDVIDTDAATVVILAGTNDIVLTPIPNPENVRGMVAAALAAGMHVVMCEIPPNTGALPYGMSADQSDVDTKIDVYNRALVQIAHDLGVPIADYYDALILPDGSQDLSLFRDHTHPNVYGYHAMWAVLHPLL